MCKVLQQQRRDLDQHSADIHRTIICPFCHKEEILNPSYEDHLHYEAAKKLLPCGDFVFNHGYEDHVKMEAALAIILLHDVTWAEYETRSASSAA